MDFSHPSALAGRILNHTELVAEEQGFGYSHLESCEFINLYMNYPDTVTYGDPNLRSPDICTAPEVPFPYAGSSQVLGEDSHLGNTKRVCLGDYGYCETRWRCPGHEI
jgi:hypothetical protein